MAEDLEVRFESLLRSTLKAEAGSLPVSVVPADILRRRDQTRRKHASRRIRLLLIAALIVVPLGALAVGVLRPDPSTQEYTAVLVRGLGDSEVQVLVASNGVAERLVEVPASRLGAIEAVRVLEASASGWIALHASDLLDAETDREYVVLMDVRNRDAAPIVREGTNHGAWTPAGLYWSATNVAYELIDPVSGNIISLPRSVSEDLDWWWGGIYERMRVAADGSGLLLGDPRNAVHDETGAPYPQQWGVLSPAGSLSRGLPELAEGIGPRLISARWGLLQRCEAAAGIHCPGRRSGSILSGPASDGSYRQWGGDPPPHDHVIGASWAVDGGLWLLVDRRSEARKIVIIHRDEDQVDREVTSFIVDLDEDVRIGDLAADDSLIALGLSGRWPVVQTVIVDTRSGKSQLFDGAVGGFVPAAAAKEWAVGERATEAGQLLGRPTTGGGFAPAYPALPPLQEHIDFVESLGAERILLTHEVDATSADPGPTTQVTLGPVELEEGIGHSLVCSGPGEVTVTQIAPDGHESPETHRCLSASGFSSGAFPGVRWESATVRIEYDPSTAWRLIVFDPQPPRQRP